MKKLKYLFLFLAPISAFLILFISVQSSSRQLVSNDSSLKERKFYFEKEILPDHSLYPLIMIVDRMRMGVAEPEEKIYLESSYANRRFFYAKRLVEKGETCLAATTFTKAQKYLNQSLMGAINLLETSNNWEQEDNQKLAFFILENFDKCQQILDENKGLLEDSDKSTVDSLEEESLMLKKKLESKLFDM